MLTCTRRLQWCSGHRVMGHENKCSHLHGHNYVGMFTARAKPGEHALDSIGRVIDFSSIKALMGSWIEENLDHGMILNQVDEAVIEFLEHFDPREDGETNKLYLMSGNPTAERIAAHLGEEIAPHLFRHAAIEIIEIVLWETENCYATWRKE